MALASQYIWIYVYMFMIIIFPYSESDQELKTSVPVTLRIICIRDKIFISSKIQNIILNFFVVGRHFITYSIWIGIFLFLPLKLPCCKRIRWKIKGFYEWSSSLSILQKEYWLAIKVGPRNTSTVVRNTYETF